MLAPTQEIEPTTRERRPRLTVPLSVAGFLLPLISVLASHGVVPLLVITAVVVVPIAWRSGHRFVGPDNGLSMGIGALLAWCAVTSFWAPNTIGSLVLTLRIGALFAAGFLLHAAAWELDDEARKRVGWWFVAGMLVSLAIMAGEVAFDFPLSRLLRPDLPPRFEPAILLNRGATAMAMLCWPAVAVLWRSIARPAAPALPAMIGIVLSFLVSMSAGTGLIGGALTAAVTLAHRKAGRIVLVAASLAALIGSPIAAKYFYAQGWQDAPWLAYSAQYRVVIWHGAVERIGQRPLFGWGFDSARALPKLPVEAGGNDPRSSALHPHNAPLQVLVELGIVGALVVLALLWRVSQRIQTLARPERVCAHALFLSTLTVSLTAYGVWQNQWLALIVMAALVTAWTART